MKTELRREQTNLKTGHMTWFVKNLIISLFICFIIFISVIHPPKNINSSLFKMKWGNYYPLHQIIWKGSRQKIMPFRCRSIDPLMLRDLICQWRCINMIWNISREYLINSALDLDLVLARGTDEILIFLHLGTTHVLWVAAMSCWNIYLPICLLRAVTWLLGHMRRWMTLTF